MSGKWHEVGHGARVLNYASLYEDKTLEQAAALARGHVTEGHVVMLPDAHFGMGACVGTAVKTRGGLYPAAVGVDIGCGMAAVRTSLKGADLDEHQRRILRGLIERAVPSGVGRSRETPLEDWDRFLDVNGFVETVWRGDRAKRQSMFDTAAIQYGTLGSGNHFVEISVDETDDVWAIVHSGSRGVGNNIARIYVDQAKRLRREDRTRLENVDLAFLGEGDPEFAEYVEGMLWAQAWARGNREAMMSLVLQQLTAVAGGYEQTFHVNCHHNYSELQDDGAWLTRKGAIDASLGRHGILPGSMSTDTYVTEGLGNAEAYNTAPHGAGRLHARGKPPRAAKGDKAAKAGTGAWAKFSVEEFAAKMAARGVAWQDRDAHALLDESPMMYKPIEVVLADSVDLVRPLHRLVQICNYKGL